MCPDLNSACNNELHAISIVLSSVNNAVEMNWRTQEGVRRSYEYTGCVNGRSLGTSSTWIPMDTLGPQVNTGSVAVFKAKHEAP